MTGRLSEVCIASDRFHQVIEVLIDFGGYSRQVRLCGECGLWDTYIQEEHGPEQFHTRLPPPEPPGYYEERMKRRQGR
jgi:hypothetical protein